MHISVVVEVSRSFSIPFQPMLTLETKWIITIFPVLFPLTEHLPVVNVLRPKECLYGGPEHVALPLDEGEASGLLPIMLPDNPCRVTQITEGNFRSRGLALLQEQGHRKNKTALMRLWRKFWLEKQSQRVGFWTTESSDWQIYVNSKMYILMHGQESV